MAASAMADEPVADLNVAEVSGNATVTWGADLDNSFASGFKNEGEATLKVNFANKGSKSTEGDGVWGELGVEVTQNVGFKSHTGSTDESGIGYWDGDNGGKIKVSAAKLHFGPVYVGITKGDTQVGDYKVTNAIMSADNGDNAIQIGGVGPADVSQGIVAGYGDDNFGIDVDL
ncbi:MAG: autotransporter, partial [Treponema sp.]|nr:autotransporter [Treponema sp.]